MPLLVSNLEGTAPKDCAGADRSLAGQVVKCLVNLVATVSPGAKRGATAPYSFADFVEVLQLCRNDGNANPAKWPVVTCFLAYSQPDVHVCVKPTTIKKVASRLGVDIAYRPLPNFDTYSRVQAMVRDFRQHSVLAREQNNIIAQAIMYCTV